MESSLSSAAETVATNLPEKITMPPAGSKKRVNREGGESLFTRGEHLHVGKRAEKRSGKAADMKHSDMCDEHGNVLGYSAMLSVCPKLSFTGARIKGGGGVGGVSSSCVSTTSSLHSHQQLIPLPNTKVGSLEIYARFPKHYDYLMSRHDCSDLGDVLGDIIGKLNLSRIGARTTRRDSHREHTTEVHTREADSPLSAVASPTSVPNPIEGYSSLSLLDLGCGTGRISRLLLSRFAGGSAVNRYNNNNNNNASHSLSSSSSSVLLTHIVGYDKYGPMLRVFDEMIEGDLLMREQQLPTTRTGACTATTTSSSSSPPPTVVVKKVGEDDSHSERDVNPLRRKLIRVEFPTEETKSSKDEEAMKDDGFLKMTTTHRSASLSICNIDNVSSKGCREKEKNAQRTEEEEEEKVLLLSGGQEDFSVSPLYVCLRPASYEALRTLPRRRRRRATTKGEKRTRSGEDEKGGAAAAERETEENRIIADIAQDAPKIEINESAGKASATNEHAKEDTDDQRSGTDVAEHILWPRVTTVSSDKESQQTRDCDASRHWPMDVAVMAWSLSYVMRAQWGVDTWHASVDALLTNLLTGPFGVSSSSLSSHASSSLALAEGGTQQHNVDVSLEAQGKDGAISQAFAEVCRVLSASSSTSSSSDLKGSAEAKENAAESLEGTDDKRKEKEEGAGANSKDTESSQQLVGGDIFPLFTLLPSSSAHLDRIPRGPPRAAIVVIETLGNNTSVPTRRNVLSEYLMARWGFLNALFPLQPSSSKNRDTPAVSKTVTETLSPPSASHMHQSSSSSGSAPATPPAVVPFIRTDYVFNTLEEGEKLCNFFFASSATAGGLTRDDNNNSNTTKYRLKECTGVWVKYIW